MSADKIIGLVTATRGFTFKLVAEHYGGPRFEMQDVFSTRSAQCRVEDEEAVAATLYALAKRDVIHDVNAAVQEYAAITGNQPKNYPAILYAMPAEPAPVSIETPAPAPETPTAPPAPEGDYVVAEKAAAPATAPAAPPVPAKADPPHKAVAERLKTLGVKKHEMTAWTNIYFKFPAGKLTPEQYLEAFTEAEKYIAARSLSAFCAYVIEKTPAPAQQAVTDPATDPATQDAMAQIQKKWPAWSPELTRIASLWCVDQVKDAAALDAFLISCGIAAVTPPGKIESLLAISRHMALSSGSAIMNYSKQSGNPLGMLESDLSAAVGKSIRFAVDLPANAVFNAFTAIVKDLAEAKK